MKYSPKERTELEAKAMEMQKKYMDMQKQQVSTEAAAAAK
jgi:hypothetical protein